MILARVQEVVNAKGRRFFYTKKISTIKIQLKRNDEISSQFFILLALYLWPCVAPANLRSNVLIYTQLVFQFLRAKSKFCGFSELEIE